MAIKAQRNVNCVVMNSFLLFETTAEQSPIYFYHKRPAVSPAWVFDTKRDLVPRSSHPS